MTEQIARWAEALDPQLIATTASPAHVASVIEQARQHILALTKKTSAARKPPALRESAREAIAAVQG